MKNNLRHLVLKSTTSTGEREREKSIRREKFLISWTSSSKNSSKRQTFPHKSSFSKIKLSFRYNVSLGDGYKVAVLSMQFIYLSFSHHHLQLRDLFITSGTETRCSFTETKFTDFSGSFSEKPQRVSWLFWLCLREIF